MRRRYAPRPRPSYTHATYLQHALGLPAANTNPAIESVTYDRFQWLLQQPGSFAILIGDPATDATFAARAQDVEAAAKAAGVKKVYWFNPNLSGSAAGRHDHRARARHPQPVRHHAAQRDLAGDLRQRLAEPVSQDLGNGVTTTLVNGEVGDEDPAITAATGTAAVNDAGLSAGGALYDYSGGAAPAKVLDSFFFIYDKDRTAPAARRRRSSSWADLTAKGSSPRRRPTWPRRSTAARRTSTSLDQFAWWKSEVNARQLFTGDERRARQAGPGPHRCGQRGGGRRLADQPDHLPRARRPAQERREHRERGDPVRRHVVPEHPPGAPGDQQVRAGERRHASSTSTPSWTAATVGGLARPARSTRCRRATRRSSGATDKSNPSFLYGDVLAQYLNNIKTQYDPATNNVVTYYTGGGAAAP